MGTIYILENKVNGKCYIGQTTQNFKKRFRKHCQSHSYIGNALRRYGIDNFNKLLLENVPEEELNYWEIHYIQECNSISPNGYNLTYGGDKPPTCIGNTWNIGKIHTKEHNKKISESNKGRISGMKDKHQSEEAKKKISIGNKGKTLTEENKKNISKSKIGIPLKEEHKKNISKSLKGLRRIVGLHRKGTLKSENWKRRQSEIMKKLGIIPPSRKGIKRSTESIEKQKITRKNNRNI